MILIRVYRSARTVWLGALPMLAALLAGAAAVDLLFGKMYMITLAFSVTLLGETLDYPTYLFSHRRMGETVTGTLRQLWPTLRLCVATTLLGCLAMIDADFPGLSQLGVFTIAGIAAAVATTRWLLPALLPPDWTPPRPGEHRRLGGWAVRTAAEAGAGVRRRGLAAAGGVDRSGAGAVGRRSRRAQSGAARAAAAGSGIARRAGRAGSRPPDRHHRAGCGNRLRHGEPVAAWLDARQTEGALAGYDGAMRYLPSQQTQRQRQARLPTPETLEANLAIATAGLPFRPGLFQPFLDAVAAARAAPPLRPEDLRGTLLGARVNMLLFPGERGWTALLPLSGVRDARALAAGLPQGEFGRAYYLDLRAETNRLVAGFREATLVRFGWGAALIVAVVWVGLRSWRRVAAALLPVATGAGGGGGGAAGAGRTAVAVSSGVAAAGIGHRRRLWFVLQPAWRRSGFAPPHPARAAGLLRFGLDRVWYARNFRAAGAAGHRPDGQSGRGRQFRRRPGGWRDRC